VPIKHKDALQKEYKSIVDAMFSTLRSSERDRSMSRFKERVSNMKGGNQLRSERERLVNKVRQMEQDIALLENNIGFFSKSKNAESLIADVREKIARAKRDMSELIEKVKLIDEHESHNA
jgi:exonuclease VII small subunit